MIKKELKEALDEKGIKNEDNASNAEPEKIPKSEVTVNIVSELPKSVSVEPTEIGGDVHPTYGKLSLFQWTYLKQNPEKFALKFGKGEVPVIAPVNPLVSKLKK